MSIDQMSTEGFVDGLREAVPMTRSVVDEHIQDYDAEVLLHPLVSDVLPRGRPHLLGRSSARRRGVPGPPNSMTESGMTEAPTWVLKAKTDTTWR